MKKSSNSTAIIGIKAKEYLVEIKDLLEEELSKSKTIKIGLLQKINNLLDIETCYSTSYQTAHYHSFTFYLLEFLMIINNVNEKQILATKLIFNIIQKQKQGATDPAILIQKIKSYKDIFTQLFNII